MEEAGAHLRPAGGLGVVEVIVIDGEEGADARGAHVLQVERLEVTDLLHQT